MESSGTAHQYSGACRSVSIGDDLNLPSYAAPSSGSEAAAGTGNSYGTMDHGPGNGNGQGPPDGRGGPTCAEDATQARCNACEETSGLWFCNRGSSSKVPLGGLEWPAMAGAGYALHRLRRRENSEDEDGEDGSDALP